MNSIQQPRSIFPQLVALSGRLKHYTDDLWEHDFKALDGMPTGSSWLWIVHQNGTHLVRWDCDPHCGTRDSMVEVLIRALVRGDWSTAACYIFHVEGETELGPLGWVSGSLAPTDLQAALPRPKSPIGLVPGAQPVQFDAAKQECFSAASGFYYLNKTEATN